MKVAPHLRAGSGWSCSGCTFQGSAPMSESVITTKASPTSWSSINMPTCAIGNYLPFVTMSTNQSQRSIPFPRLFINTLFPHSQASQGNQCECRCKTMAKILSKTQQGFNTGNMRIYNGRVSLLALKACHRGWDMEFVEHWHCGLTLRANGRFHCKDTDTERTVTKTGSKLSLVHPPLHSCSSESSRRECNRMLWDEIQKQYTCTRAVFANLYRIYRHQVEWSFWLQLQVDDAKNSDTLQEETMKGIRKGQLPSDPQVMESDGHTKL